MMNNYVLKAALGLMAALMLSVESHASAVSTTWRPTDGNVNVIQYAVGLPSLGGGELALFESADDFTGSALVLGMTGGVFDFTDNLDGTFTVEGFVNNVSVGSLLMTGDDFMLGVRWGGGPWVGNYGQRQAVGDPTTYMTGFLDRPNRAAASITDVVLVDRDLPPVPIPASALLFATALLGLVGVKRRKA